MQNSLVNLSGKSNAFQPLDQLNEYIVREVKNKMQPYMTESTDDHLRNTVSLVIMFFPELKRRFAEETDAHIFDFHSSSVDEWCDVQRVMEKILDENLMQLGGPKCGANVHVVPDLFMDGISVLADGVVIAKVKECLTNLGPCTMMKSIVRIWPVL